MPKRTKKRNKNSLLSKKYFNTKDKAGFGGKASITKAFKGKVSPDQVNKWLEQTDTYTLHKPVRKHFSRRGYVVTGINHLVQMDLAVFSQFSQYNDGYKYILMIIDVFSRKGYGTALKTKGGKEVSEAIDHFLRNEKSVLYCQTDKGSEFLNSYTKNVFSQHNVHHYTYTNEEIKASYVERFTRTLKQKMYRYFTHSNSYRYIDVLQGLLEAYNSTVHSAHNKAPNDIHYSNQEEAWQMMYNPDEPVEIINTKFKFKIGDRVRISKYSTVFAKSYLPSWTEEIFTISKRHTTRPPVYSITDDHGDELTGTWYEPELQKVNTDDNTYKIESIVSQRKVNGKVQYLVKWLGYDSSFNSYVNKSDLVLNYKN